MSVLGNQDAHGSEDVTERRIEERQLTRPVNVHPGTNK